MPDIFLPFPFAEPDMLAAMLGPDRAETLDLRPAEARGLALRADPRGARVALCRDPGARAEGMVLRRPEKETAERLRFVLTGFGGWRPVVAPTTAGAAEAMLAPLETAPAAPWPAAPEPEWRVHLAEAAAEIAAFHGARAAEDLAGLLPGISFRALARARGAAEAAPAAHRRGFRRDEIETTALDRPYASYFAVEEHRLRHPRFDGRTSPELLRAVWASGDAVTLVPFDPGRRAVLLVEQFRPGPFARRDPCPWCLEPIAGRCDAGETVEETARREAEEEAGLALGRMERIAGYYSSPGTIAEHLTSFVGEADLSGAGGVHGLAEEDEDIRTLVLPLEEALRLVETGEINNGPLVLTLFWLRTEAERLARDWAQPA